MRKLLGTLVVVCGLLSLGVFIPTIASATLVYDNAPPDHSSGTGMTIFIVAEDFPLGPGTLTGVRFWDVGDPRGYNGSISWGIYSNSLANTPGTLLFSGNTSIVTRTPTGCNTGVCTSFPEFQNDFALPNVPLSGGQYWLGLHNGPLPQGTTPENFFWETHTGPDLAGQYCQVESTGKDFASCSGTDWSVTPQGDHAFQLFGNVGVVPEPSTLLLLGSALPGLAGILVHRRRRIA